MKRTFIYILTALWCLILLFNFSGKPRFGQFLNFSTGFMQIQDPDNSEPITTEITFKDYAGSIHLDSVGVPHIFTETEKSATFLTGYMHARDRMFQMELMIRMVQGRLSEIVGEKAVPMDTYWKNWNFDKRYDAYVKNELIKNKPIYDRVMAYADGVNYYHETMNYSSIPEEYFLLDIKPMKWKPYYSMLLIKYMAHMLSSRRLDNYLQDLIEVLPENIVKQFYPMQETFLESTIPEKTGKNNPNTREESWEKRYGKQRSFLTEKEKYDQGNQNSIGSNNWVVSAKKSKSGEAILANDMHLKLTLPAPWYEIHIKTNDKHVYGLSLPCSPFIIAGHNEAISWGMTNASWDLTDVYDIVYTNDTKTEYFKGTGVKKVEHIVDTIYVKGKAPVIFTKRITDFGPIIDISGKEFALSWIANKVSNDGVTFQKMEFASTFKEFETALSSFSSPPQNFVYADTAGNIGVHTSGDMWKIKQSHERGVYLSTDTNKLHSEYILFKDLPNIYNPEKGFVATANQRQLHNSEDYYSWWWAMPYRGFRISEMLREKESITLADIQEIQADITDRSATQLLPLLFEAIGNDAYQKDIKLLKKWSHQMKPDEIAPTIYDAFRTRLIKSLVSFIHQNREGLSNPNEWTVISNILAHDTFTNGLTELSRDSVLKSALDSAITHLEEEFGTDRKNWMYGNYHTVSMTHLLRLKGFSEPKFPSGGSGYTVNVAKYRNTTHGASQRSIIHMTTPIESYFNIAGGQSGRPTSKHFTDQLDDWKKVSHRKSQFVKSANELSGIVRTISFKKQD